MFRSLLLLIALTGLPAALTEEAKNYSHAGFLLSVSPPPQLAQNYVVPQIKASAALVMDLDSGMIIYEKNSSSPFPMASLTKIMTAILILEEHDLGEEVTINIDFDDLEGSTMKLVKNEVITIENLLYGLLINSGNDAAKMLAYYNAGGMDQFVVKMNNRAKELGLKNTNFMNSMGYDDQNHYASAYDLALLSTYALKNSFFQEVVQKKIITIASVDGRIKHHLNNTNELLQSYLNIKGIKTGTTDQAGQCLIALLETKSHQNILCVILNSEDRFQETKVILDNIINNYYW